MLPPPGYPSHDVLALLCAHEARAATAGAAAGRATATRAGPASPPPPATAARPEAGGPSTVRRSAAGNGSSAAPRHRPQPPAWLSAEFAEWMMDVPGLITRVPDIARTHQLRIIGNGVVPQQAAAALWLLIDAAAIPAPLPSGMRAVA
jgi:hypothetical protein